MASISEENGQASRRSSRRFSGSEKFAAVHRILRGEEPNRVAAELHITPERLRRWERVFLEGGRQSLAKHRDFRSGFGLLSKARELMPWGGLVLVLIAIVYLASRFLQQGAEP